MPYFCIFDHPKMPLTQILVLPKRRDSTRDGFRLRYVLRVSDERHADDVVSLVDGALASKCRAHGVYQAGYDEVRAAYDALLHEATRSAPNDDMWRSGALILGVALTVVMCLVVPPVVLLFLFVSAIKRQSGLAAMVESSVVASIFDWRPLIHKLFRYSQTGTWK